MELIVKCVFRPDSEYSEQTGMSRPDNVRRAFNKALEFRLSASSIPLIRNYGPKPDMVQWATALKHMMASPVEVIPQQEEHEAKEEVNEDDDAPDEVPVEREEKPKISMKKKATKPENKHVMSYYHNSLTYCLQHRITKEDLELKDAAQPEESLAVSERDLSPEKASVDDSTSAEPSPDAAGDAGTGCRGKRKSDSDSTGSNRSKYKRLDTMTKHLIRLGYVFQPGEHYRHPDTPQLKDAEAKYM